MTFAERLRELHEKAESGVLVVAPAAESRLRQELRNALPDLIAVLEAAEWHVCEEPTCPLSETLDRLNKRGE